MALRSANLREATHLHFLFLVGRGIEVGDVEVDGPEGIRGIVY